MRLVITIERLPWPMKVDKDFSAARYASGVANELLWALEGLVEER